MNATRLAWVLARVASAAVLLVTWGYGVTALSPFAFDMFVKPRLFPWLESFVTWHHIWFFGAYFASVATLVPIVAAGRKASAPHLRAAWWASISYLAVVGASAASLLVHPRLPLIVGGGHDWFVVPGALVPLLWLSLIDHLTGWPHASDVTGQPVTATSRVMLAALASALVVWAAHSIDQAIGGSAMAALPWSLARSWALALDAAAFVAITLTLSLAAGIAAATRHPVRWEYGLSLVLFAGGIAEFMRRLVFPPLMIDQRDAIATAIPFGIAFASMLAGLRLGTRPERVAADTGLDLLAAFRGARAVRLSLLVGVPLAAWFTARAVAPVDWSMILVRVVALVEAALVFSLLLESAREWKRPGSTLTLMLAPFVIVLALHGVPRIAHAVTDATGDGRADPERLLDGYRAADPLTDLAAAAFVAQRESDPRFYGDLVEAERRFSTLEPQTPETPFTTRRKATETPPHVFLFVIDSLRRDYLSAYNPAVSFTPAIGAWASDQFVFRNAFTQYGGTWLSMPAIWTGSAVTRRWAGVFPWINALEQLTIDAGYDVMVNDFTVASLLRPDAPRTFLDPGVKSVDTDLCQNLSSLRAHIDGRTSTRSIFAYLAPMNVHLLNTRSGASDTKAEYAGFYAPYATRLQRIDGCFGQFVDFLKARGLYDDSVIILTSDHGDSLGEEGRWGHQFYIRPEILRVPLIVGVPAKLRARLTTDLGGLAFLTDITPTLYALLGYAFRDAGPGFGQPLFVGAGDAPRSRRREPFLVVSSYGASYGSLRRNGRLLYAIDLVNRKEDAFTMSREPLGEERPASDALRRLGQADILAGLGQVEQLFTSPPSH